LGPCNQERNLLGHKDLRALSLSLREAFHLFIAGQLHVRYTIQLPDCLPLPCTMDNVSAVRAKYLTATEQDCSLGRQGAGDDRLAFGGLRMRETLE
ncbi:MAG: hypothetical protein M1823_008948, partial [Watsoniomyces obsoletus]